MRFFRLLLVLLSFSASLLAADSPFSGTWKFNPSKGHLTPPIPKKFSEEGVDEKGSAVQE